MIGCYTPLAGHDVGVGDGVGDGDVSVHGDDDEVEDAGGAGPHVHRQPHEAQLLPKHPAVHHLQFSNWYSASAISIFYLFTVTNQITLLTY